MIQEIIDGHMILMAQAKVTKSHGFVSPTGVTPGSGSSAGHTALKFGGPNHSGDCGGGYSENGECCCWYDLGIRANGDLQFQIERPHPDNTDFDPGGAQLFDNVGHEMEGNDTGLKDCCLSNQDRRDSGRRWNSYQILY